MVKSSAYSYIYLSKNRVSFGLHFIRNSHNNLFGGEIFYNEIWLIVRHIKPSWVILWQDVRESHSLNVHIYIFYVVISYEIFYAVSSNKIIFKQIYLIHWWCQAIYIRVTRGVMAMKRYFALLRSSELEPHHWMQLNFIFSIHPFRDGGSY